MNYRSLIILTLALLPSAAHAFDIGFRAQANVGMWQGAFRQSDSASHNSRVTSLPSAGFQGQLGANLAVVFVEYNVAAFLPSYVMSSRSTPNTRDSNYVSLMGFNLGALIPIIPIEPYVGYEQGSYEFSSGSKTEYSGHTGKVGLNVNIPLTPIGFKAEYRLHLANEDQAGTLPTSISTRTHLFFVGLTLGKR